MQLTSDKLRLLTKGANSQIYVYGQASKVVLKVVATSCAKEVRHLANEQAILAKLEHSNIIRSLKYKQNICINGICRNVLVLEYANRGSLLDFIKIQKLNIPQIRHLFFQLAQTIQYLHCNYIVHRDLKLQNVLITTASSKAKIKLSDFGFACSYYQDQKIKMFNSFKGTRRGYMAPEIHELLENPSQTYDATKADIFALGVILFALVFAKLPFEFANKQNKIFKQIQNLQFDLFWQNHSHQISLVEMKEHSMIEDLKDLFIKMVLYNPDDRITIKEVLEHSWFKGLKSQIQLN